MRPRAWFRVSLARKISLRFGTAVLLTIAATLAFPWMQMAALNEHALLLQAKRVASIAYDAVDLSDPDWVAAEAQVAKRWPVLARELELPTQRPRLVSVDSVVGSGFQRAAVDRLQRYPHQRDYWRFQDDGNVFRFAMGVRHADADPHPTALRGIIDVHLPIQQGPAVWNAVVTALAGASGAVLAILAFYLVTQRVVLSPLDALRRAARMVTTGDISVRTDITTGDEFEQLSKAFNEMLAHLKDAQDEQEKINRSLDIRLGELAETNVGLYESNRLKVEFLTNVTHELRTPLVSIIGFAELLRDAWDDPGADRKRLVRYSQNILTSGRSLLDIINDLLDVAKIEAGEMEVHLTEFSMAQLCCDMIDFVRPLADKREMELELHIAEDLPDCRSDTGKIKQILYNLLSNAIKFTQRGGCVSLVAKLIDQGGVALAVSDSGPGIAPDQHELVFEKFRQLDASQTREHEGTGLGLAITRELVSVLGGVIRLESSIAAGSTFTVELPLTLKDDSKPAKARRTPSQGMIESGNDII